MDTWSTCLFLIISPSNLFLYETSKVNLQETLNDDFLYRIMNPSIYKDDYFNSWNTFKRNPTFIIYPTCSLYSFLMLSNKDNCKSCGILIHSADWFFCELYICKIFILYILLRFSKNLFIITKKYWIYFFWGFS